MDGRIIAAVSNQPHACGHGIQIRQGHAPRRKHPAVAVDKGYHRSNQVPVWNPGGDGDDWQNRDIEEQTVERDLQPGLHDCRKIAAGEAQKGGCRHSEHGADDPQEQGEQSADGQLASQQSGKRQGNRQNIFQRVVRSLPADDISGNQSDAHGENCCDVVLQDLLHEKGEGPYTSILGGGGENGQQDGQQHQENPCPDHVVPFQFPKFGFHQYQHFNSPLSFYTAGQSAEWTGQSLHSKSKRSALLRESGIAVPPSCP